MAAVTADGAAAYTAGTPAAFAPVAEVAAKPKTAQDTYYADNVPFEVLVGEGETTIEMTVTGIPMEMLAAISGKVFDATTGRFYGTQGTPPDYALGFRSLKSNGKYRYFWFLKGKFSVPEETFKTRTDKSEAQPIKITYTAVFSIYAFDVGDTNEKVKEVKGDEDTENFSATGWWTQVQVPSVASPSALALSSSTPADELTGVSKTADIVLVFNNTLALGAENGCILVANVSQAVVAATVTISADRKTVTINPDASLGATTVYDIVIGVTDIYGDTLAALVNFTTTS